ncbi:unnamed protein product [Protopolystoma xenopodis]|uniref:Uncharacterized protein n=1 Tax=Protopolystoma xenopodis TaxID=117903 RepID=A0A3S5BTL0_9PLAT|nr:unnamed protein product [Protopolystoma xenopodis]
MQPEWFTPQTMGLCVRIWPQCPNESVLTSPDNKALQHACIGNRVVPVSIASVGSTCFSRPPRAHRAALLSLPAAASSARLAMPTSRVGPLTRGPSTGGYAPVNAPTLDVVMATRVEEAKLTKLPKRKRYEPF